MKEAINTIWAENTTNKANMSNEEIARGILFESAIESKFPNTAFYKNAKALKELQESGALWIEGKNYPQGSIVSLMVNLGLFVTQRMFLKIGANNNASFPYIEKSIFQEFASNTIYNVKPINSTDWQEIQGYMSANLIGDFNVNSRAYQYGENCYIWINRATNEIALQKPNNPLPYLWQRVLLQSLKDENTTEPNKQSLCKEWIIQDGFEVGHALIDTANRQERLGYLLINQANFNDTLSFNDYPRVKAMMDNLGATQPDSEWGVFKRINDNSFKLNNDKRGYFFRLFSNGGNIDRNRNFQSLQECGLPNISVIVTGWRNRIAGSAAANSAVVGMTVGGSGGYSASNVSRCYKVGWPEVTPYNFNINLFVKV